jgi:CheY-like chemotaxis protein
MEQERILIVDDDPDITEAMKIVLENNGYKVDSALNGEEAMDKINLFKPDLLILDVMMNTLHEGFLLSRQLKKDSRHKKIPILIVTGIQEKTGIDFSSAAGDEDWLPVEAYLDKPVKPELLLEKVQTLLSR